MRPAVFTVRKLALVGQHLYSRVEICDVHNGPSVSDGVVTDVLFDDVQKCFPVRIGRWNVNFHKSGSNVRREVLLTHVGSGIHTSEDAEIWVTGNWFQGPLLGKCDRGNIALEKAGDTLQSLCTREVDFIEKNPVLTSRIETRLNGYDKHVPIPRTKRLDEWSFHKSKSKLPLSLDMLDVKGPKLLFKFVPVCLRYALVFFLYPLPLPGSLLVGVQLIAAIEKFLVSRRDAI